MVYKFFDKRFSGNCVDAELNELHRQIFIKFKKRIVSSSFRYNIWLVVLADKNHSTNTRKK